MQTLPNNLPSESTTEFGRDCDLLKIIFSRDLKIVILSNSNTFNKSMSITEIHMVGS